MCFGMKGLDLTYERRKIQTKCKSLGVVNGELICLKSGDKAIDCSNCSECEVDDEVQEMWEESGQCLQDSDRRSR